MKKLIIQIPCYNEEESLPVTLADLPREVEGFDNVEWLIIDDGSTDETIKVAKKHGVDHIVRHTQNRGLAYAFMSGINAGLEQGADVIVNTDADNQYCAFDIPLLTKPITDGNVEIVIGARPIAETIHFSPVKKFLQKFGSLVVRATSRTEVADAPSGFRAFSREAAQRLMVFNEYTYTLETIIQAGQKNMSIISVPIRTNEDLRESRLVKSIASYVKRSMVTILRIFFIYRPAKVLGWFAAASLLAGTLIGMRFTYHYLTGSGDGMVQSLILAGVLLTVGFQSGLAALLADLISANRRLSEEIRFRQLVFSDLLSVHGDKSSKLEVPEVIKTRHELQQRIKEDANSRRKAG